MHATFSLLHAARQLLPYVFPVVEHTGDPTLGQEQAAVFTRDGITDPFLLKQGQLPSHATLTLAHLASQELLYCFPLLPHTGSFRVVQVHAGPPSTHNNRLSERPSTEHGPPYATLFSPRMAMHGRGFRSEAKLELLFVLLTTAVGTYLTCRKTAPKLK